MTDLDEKLSFILEEYREFIKGVYQGDFDYDEVVATLAIKQAFKDAGYIFSEKYSKRLVEVALLESSKLCNNDWHKMYGSNPGHANEMIMTGQEWYDKFNKALDEDESMIYDIHIEGVLDAAKKASGLL